MLIDAISAAGMKSTLSTRGGRSVARQFAHLHNVRVWHLEKRARTISAGLYKFPTEEEPSRKKLTGNLNQSCERIAQYFTENLSGGSPHRCFKKGPIPYLGYFIAHESHHRGNILLTLKQSGHPLDKDSRYAIWNWDNL